MTNLVNFLQQVGAAVPEKAWTPLGTIIAATIAVLGVGLSLWRQSVTGRRQREFELRRTELFKLMEDAALGLQVFNEAGTLEKTTLELGRIRLPLMASHTRAMCFADYDTIKRSYDLEIAFAKGWHPVAQTLNYHELVKRLVTVATTRWDAEADPSKKMALQQSVDDLEQRRQRIHTRLLERTAAAGRTYAEVWTELEIAVRAEIHRANRGGFGKEMSPDEYRKTVDSAISEIERLNKGSKEWNRKFFTLVSAGPSALRMLQDFERDYERPADDAPAEAT